MSPLQFKDPGPPTGNSKPNVEHLLAAHELRQRPGQWAVIKDGLSQSQAAGLVKRVRDGEIVAYAPRGTFESTARRSAGGKYEVFARTAVADAVAEPTPIRRRKAAGGAR